MTKRAGALLILSTALLLFIVHRAAYKGYFQDDEIDNLSWTRLTPVSDFGRELISPRFLGNNFRPVGHLYFRAMESAFGLDFPKYVLVLHLLHLANVILVWNLARRLGAGPLAATLGTLFFAFHMAAFDAVWKPMYIFDVLCAFFCLSSLLLYARGSWILSFAAFWLAYKSKELAVMLPAVLLLYEYWFGARRWVRLVPFFAVSLSFGVQGVLLNPNRDNDYTLRFTPTAAWTSLAYYSGKIFLLPFAGFVLVAAAILIRNRAVRFGLAVMVLFFAPLLFLPGRLFGAYTYLPLTGFALAAASLAALDGATLVLACALLWIPWNLHHLRMARRYALFAAEQNRAYLGAVAQYAQGASGTPVFLYDAAPPEMRRWGIEGALRYFTHRPDLKLYSVEDREASEILRSDSFTLLAWDEGARRLLISARRPGEPDAPFLAMTPATPVWQLGEGWYRLETRFRWIQPYATARLGRPSGATEFELTVNTGQELIRGVGRTRVTVLVDGQEIGTGEFSKIGFQTVRWPAPPGPPKTVDVEFRVDPEYRVSGDARRFGVAIVSFGFRP